MAVWLVTGGSGFLGRHVLKALSATGEVDVLAMGRRCPDRWPGHRFLTADLEELESLAQRIEEARPDVVIHTAGRTPPGAPELFFRSNTLASVHLLEALAGLKRRVRVVLAGSAAELGPVEAEALPVGENRVCRPIDAYGLSKYLASCAALAARPPVEAIVARVFNPIGPGQPGRQALGRFAEALADEREETLMVGDLDVRRDFVDVRDVARAMIALGEKGEAGRVYHVGTGASHRVADALMHLMGKRGRKVAIQVDSKLAASAGPTDSVADIGRIVKDTGWRPEIGWEQSLEDLWEEARSRRVLPLTGLK